MIRGLYSGASGLRAQMARMAMMGNNLTNASTPGFKRDVAVLGAFPRMLLSRVGPGGRSAGVVGAVGTGAGLREVGLDLGQGAAVDSSRELDLSIRGAGFFALDTPDGVRYTRDGSFARGADGRLVSSQGYTVRGEAGPMALPQGPLAVRADGSVYAGEQLVGRLELIEFPAGTPLRKMGDGLLSADGGEPATQAEVRQYSLEASNVDPVQAMVDLMAASRAYETSQRLLQIQDQVLERAVTEVGRV